VSGVIRYWAGAKAAAGVAEDEFSGNVLGEVLEEVAERRGAALRQVLPRCSFLVDGAPVGLRDPGSVILADGALVEVLPPFAGG
jgi:sulfur-carrier protein